MFIEPIEFHLPVVSSTSDYAKELLATYPYVFVSAQHQTHGRGRNGKSWEGDHQANAYCSIGISHSNEESIEELSAYMARGALTVLDVITTLHPDLITRLKYPNDVQVRTTSGWAKLAGVLVEHDFRGQFCNSTVVGIGININQELFPDTITQPCTSLRLQELYTDVDVVITMIRQAFSRWRTRTWVDVHEAWVKSLNLEAKQLQTIDDEGTWTAQRILPDGRLIIRHDVTLIERTISDGDTLRYKD
ncbi:MAG: biotin--[acetyl-CoA-carboxylase] ligase [Candidatus Kapabacteria bacterium]|nr:biotin--[acetyl-CoA-carboxylase] ligase [Candidatus Kapabacteria bacterium]